MKEKIAYIGHSYHKKTKSTQFMLDYLSEFYDVETFWDESWQNNQITDYSHIDEKYKAVILFYVITNKQSLKTLKHKNIIFIPMFEAVKDWNFKNWYPYKNTKIINFCNGVHKKITKMGFNSSYLQYFPKVKEFQPGNTESVFFWQRQNKININTLKKIFKNNEVKIHIHNAIDPGKKQIIPSKQDEKKYAITYSTWFDTREEMNECIKEKGIYIAPRLEEGIGMSFLEAMAMGKAVIAHRQHTMDEYIENGKTGYLCDFKNPKPIDLKNLEQIQKNTYAYMQQGYNNWLEDRKQIIELIEKEPIKTEFPFLKKLFGYYLNMDKKDIIRTKIGKGFYLTLFGIDIVKRNSD